METPNEKVVINSRFLFDVVERSLTDAYDEKIIIGTQFSAEQRRDLPAGMDGTRRQSG